MIDVIFFHYLMDKLNIKEKAYKMTIFWNKKAETMPRDKLEKLQGKKLNNLAQFVYKNVEFYHKKFDELGIKPDDIKSVEDITKLPLTYKTDLRDHYPFKLNAVPLEEIVNILKEHCSSVNLKRFDEVEDVIQSSFLVEFDDFSQLNQCKRKLRKLDDHIQIKFLDNKGIM